MYGVRQYHHSLATMTKELHADSGPVFKTRKEAVGELRLFGFHPESDDWSRGDSFWKFTPKTGTRELAFVYKEK